MVAVLALTSQLRASFPNSVLFSHVESSRKRTIYATETGNAWEGRSVSLGQLIEGHLPDHCLANKYPYKVRMMYFWGLDLLSIGH